MRALPRLNQPCNGCSEPTPSSRLRIRVWARIDLYSQQKPIVHLQHSTFNVRTRNVHFVRAQTNVFNSFVDAKRWKKKTGCRGLACLTVAVLFLWDLLCRVKQIRTIWHDGPVHCNVVYGGEGLVHRSFQDRDLEMRLHA